MCIAWNRNNSWLALQFFIGMVRMMQKEEEDIMIVTLGLVLQNPKKWCLHRILEVLLLEGEKIRSLKLFMQK